METFLLKEDVDYVVTAWYKIKMLIYDSKDVSEGKDVNDDNENSRLCMACHFKYFHDMDFLIVTEFLIC